MKQMMWPNCAILFEQLYRVEKKHFDKLFDIRIVSASVLLAHVKIVPIQSCFLRPCMMLLYIKPYLKETNKYGVLSCNSVMLLVCDKLTTTQLLP